MADLNYVKGYLGMLEKCAQFSYNPSGDMMYFTMPEANKKELDRRMVNIDNAQRKYDDLNGWNPLNWGKMISAKYQEGHNRRELERAKRRAASDAAFKSAPIDYYTARRLARSGVKLIGVSGADAQSYEASRDAIRAGLDSPGQLYDLTSGVRAGRRAWDQTAAGQQAANIRKQWSNFRHDIYNSLAMTPIPVLVSDAIQRAYEGPSWRTTRVSPST